MSKRVRNIDLGIQPGVPRRLVVGYEPKRRVPLANQIWAEWVDVEINKYEVVECLDDANNTYRVFVRTPSGNAIQNECYYCPGTRHNLNNERCINGDAPDVGEWVLVQNESVRVGVVKMHKFEMIGTSHAGEAVVSLDRKIY